MYINRVKDLKRAQCRVDNYVYLCEIDSSKYDILLDEAIDECNYLEAQLEVLRLVLGEDVPEVKQ